MPTQGFQQVQKQTQQLVLAPQLRQSLKILQVPALELRNVILEELQTNPTLEELPYDGPSVEGWDFEPPEEGERPMKELSEAKQELDFKDNFDAYYEMQEDYRAALADENGSYSYSAEDDERRKHFFDSVTSETSLQEELMEQAHLTEATPKVLKALEYLVGSLNDNGFLEGELSEIALLSEIPLETLQEAHQLLKSLDPAGIGARNLNDCLLIQLERKGRGKSAAAEILRHHFNLLLRRRIPELARRLSLSPEQIQDAISEIALLDPAPGRRFSDDSNRVVVPDVKVEREDPRSEWVITMNNDYIPRLRISPAYKEMIAKGLLKKNEKTYVQDKFRDSRFLISSIEQRQQTIERITRVLLDKQSDFFEEGPSCLRPLTMNEVADVVGVHETTVSRAIANKYIDTPHGVFDFKYFFRTGYSGVNGADVSNTSVKERVSRIIESENPAKPLSDDAISKILVEEGIQIARRTVAKYREELGILPTNLRRRYD